MTYSMKDNEWPHTPLTQERFEAIEKAAQEGDAQASFILGYLYENGEGDIVRKHPFRAVGFYRKAAANKGHPRASMRLGKIYQYGELEATQCYASAAWRYQEALEGGIAGAEECLALAKTEVRREVAERDRKQAESRIAMAAFEKRIQAECL